MNLKLSLLPLFFLTSNVFAQSDAAVPPADPMKGILLNLPIFLALFFIFWFLVIKPQQSQQKKQTQFLSTLKKGDEVITAGGIIGTVVGLTDRVVTLDVSSGTEIKVIKTQVQALLKDAMPASPATK